MKLKTIKLKNLTEDYMNKLDKDLGSYDRKIKKLDLLSRQAVLIKLQEETTNKLIIIQDTLIELLKE